MSLKKFFSLFWYALPVQLFLLHFRKHQELLILWYILFSTVTGHFLSNFGADSLFLTPEYFGSTNFISTAIVGFAFGIFLMSWNIATFILHARSIRFLVTTAQPFLKYCINNAILPLFFFFIYFYQMGSYASNSNLFSSWAVVGMLSGLLLGSIASIAISFLYFFGADKTIYKNLSGVIRQTTLQFGQRPSPELLHLEKPQIPVKWFLSARLHWRKPRDVRHYPASFIEAVFQRHHFSAIIAILIAFIFLIFVGFSSDTRLFQLPAAASIILFFSLLIAFAAALIIFLKNWTLPILVVVFFLLQWLYQQDVLDVRNKVYGLDYTKNGNWPEYSREALIQMSHPDSIRKDKEVYERRLENWKSKQTNNKPRLLIINTSGGGSRSATFTFHVLQHLDSITGGQLMRQTFLITGASGGMLGASYFRELYARKQQNKIKSLQDPVYSDRIAKDLLNPLFSSFVTRDLIGPVQHFTYQGRRYPKDRGYAFERKLSENTDGVLDKPLQWYASAESGAELPTLWMHAVISGDGRKLLVSNDRLRFLMRFPSSSLSANTFTEPDAVDFQTLMAERGANTVNLLTALRMNASFPYVLPNVWLPTRPVIDVMDAGLRDNYGQESALRFVQVFQEWLKKNTSGVVLLQIRDRSLNDWDSLSMKGNLGNMLLDPLLVLNKNWYRMQDFGQQSSLNFLADAYGKDLRRFVFQYQPSKKESAASLSFHLTPAEKRDLAAAVMNQSNQAQFYQLISLLREQ
jgi:hypothetical protein